MTIRARVYYSNRSEEPKIQITAAGDEIRKIAAGKLGAEIAAAVKAAASKENLVKAAANKEARLAAAEGEEEETPKKSKK